MIKSWLIPIKTISESNASEHWTVKSKRHRQQRFLVQCCMKNEVGAITLPCHIKITRVGKRKLDFDNLTISLKWIVDAVCDLLVPGLARGRSDDDDRIKISYDQEIGKSYAVKIEIESDSILQS